MSSPRSEKEIANMFLSVLLNETHSPLPSYMLGIRCLIMEMDVILPSSWVTTIALEFLDEKVHSNHVKRSWSSFHRVFQHPFSNTIHQQIHWMFARSRRSILKRRTRGQQNGIKETINNDKLKPSLILSEPTRA